MCYTYSDFYDFTQIDNRLLFLLKQSNTYDFTKIDTL